MDRMKNVAKNGWHPTGSIRSEHKHVNQVVCSLIPTLRHHENVDQRWLGRLGRPRQRIERPQINKPQLSPSRISQRPWQLRTTSQKCQFPWWGSSRQRCHAWPSGNGSSIVRKRDTGDRGTRAWSYTSRSKACPAGHPVSSQHDWLVYHRSTQASSTASWRWTAIRYSQSDYKAKTLIASTITTKTELASYGKRSFTSTRLQFRYATTTTCSRPTSQSRGSGKARKSWRLCPWSWHRCWTGSAGRARKLTGFEPMA